MNRKSPSYKDSYFTSIHYAAAEVVLNHLRYLVAKRKLTAKIMTLHDHNIDDISDNSPHKQH